MSTEAYLSQFSIAEVNVLLQNEQCDTTDYLIAAGCGVIGGIVDVFVSSINTENVVSNFTDLLKNL